MSEQLTDKALVEKAQLGDKAAFSLLIARYQNKIAGIIGRYVDPNDIADVAQDTFIRAYRSLDSFRGESAFYTWLYRIAVNTAKNHLAAQSRRPPREDLQDEDTEGVESELGLSDNHSPESLLQSQELKDVVYNALHALPEEMKTALTLREVQGLEYSEIAEIVGCPVGTVRSRIFRARETIEAAIAAFEKRNS